MYEKYPGIINDVSQLQFMLEKVKGYGYKNIEFIIMVKVCKEFICNQNRKQKGAFGIRAEQVKYQSNYISDSLKGKGLGE